MLHVCTCEVRKAFYSIEWLGFQFVYFFNVYVYLHIYYYLLFWSPRSNLAMAQSPSSPRSALGYLKHSKQFKVYSQALAQVLTLDEKYESAIMYFFQLTRSHNLILKKMFTLFKKSSIVSRFFFFWFKSLVRHLMLST